MNHEHLNAERLQAFLDGDLPEGERAAAEAHLDVCPRCAVELDVWRELMTDLDDLPALGPTGGFAERVMSAVHVPASTAAERPVTPTASVHVEPDALQAYLDDVLDTRLVPDVERHLAACASCDAEATEWARLVTRLDTLSHFDPPAYFAEGVLARLPRAGVLPIAARMRSTIAGWVPAGAHVNADRLQAYLDGTLGDKVAARVRSHVDHCSSCARELAVWRALYGEIEALGHFTPSAGFAERVAEKVVLPRPSLLTIPAPEPAPLPLAARVGAAVRHALAPLSPLRRLVPRTRRAWAALSGVAVTPAVTMGLVLYAVFSHPTLTVGSLVSWAGWQLSDGLGAAWSAVSGPFVQSAELFGLYSLFETLAAAPMVVAGGVLIYTLVSALSLRVLYKSFFAHRSFGDHYVRASFS